MESGSEKIYDFRRYVNLKFHVEAKIREEMQDSIFVPLSSKIKLIQIVNKCNSCYKISYICKNAISNVNYIMRWRMLVQSSA